MKLTEQDLKKAVENEIITDVQYHQLIDYKKANTNSGINFLYYLGSLLIISAMTWLMASSWDTFGGYGIFILSMVYMITFSIFGWKLYSLEKYKLVGGLMFTITLCITPLALFGLLKALEIWDQTVDYGDFYIWIKGKWVVLEVGVIVVGLLMLKFIKFPFLLAPISFALWFLSMDIVPIIFQDAHFTWTERKYVSLVFGTLYLIIGYITHKKTDEKYAFWIYLFGLFTLVASLSIFYNDDIPGFILFLFINIVLIVFSFILEQRVFLIFGLIGLIEFFARLSFELFEGSIILPFIYTILGVLIVLVGLYFQKNNLSSKISELIPDKIKSIKP